MKKLKLIAVLGTLGGVLLFSTGCNSTEQPIDDKYTVSYSCYEYSGSLNITKTTVSGEQIYMPTFTLNGKDCDGYIIGWKPVAFDYFSNKTFKFEANTTAITYSGGNEIKVTGTHEYEGKFADNAKTYDVHLNYADGKSLWFAKYKPTNSSNTVSRDYPNDYIDAYDVTLNDDYDDAEKDVLLTQDGYAILNDTVS